jgi:predicted nucleic acid-binding protein
MAVSFPSPTAVGEGGVRAAPSYVADTSALARLRNPGVSARLSPLILAGDVATCGVVELEILFSARGHTDFVATRATRSRAFPLVPMIQADFNRAVDVMEELTRRGLHRSVTLPDLRIAAMAERAGLTVLHYDADFDFIAGVTGQPMEWVVPRGSVP